MTETIHHSLSGIDVEKTPYLVLNVEKTIWVSPSIWGR